ncbi:M15 family metallopeptidase [Williamsia serinedens]|uniref:D-alanyl-D-alanine dipeptidase n=1 Tax=Williamsia serinedens TaxID=391736 RepID=A0ABT1H4U7_9NOCA|nr:M15 family metallopeptidase [Williamsia serinedens]MCP2161598.1 D-Ala-D-Ala dipeptidase vanX, Metallo peptidase, MEROPS family M15D [Williamsia serinedens]
MTARVLVVCAAVLVALSLAAPTASAAPPVPKAPADFVALSDVDPTIIQEIRYFTPHNFTGDPVDGYRAPMCILTRQAAEALHRAQIGFLLQGLSLKVYDCYRPQRAVNAFVAWAKRLDDQRMKAEFYRDVDKANLFRDGYIAEQSGHSRGSTMDLTLVRLPARATRPYVRGQELVDCIAPQAQRFPDNSIDMGTGFDCFSTLSWPLDPRIQGEQLRNRVTLLNGMVQQGFVPYSYEWWHFTYKPEPFPDTYFDFPVSRSSLRR